MLPFLLLNGEMSLLLLSVAASSRLWSSHVPVLVFVANYCFRIDCPKASIMAISCANDRLTGSFATLILGTLDRDMCTFDWSSSKLRDNRILVEPEQQGVMS